MYAARKTEICFNRIAATQIALDACVDLIAFRNSQGGIEAPRKLRVQHAKLADQQRIRAQRLRKTKVRGNECTTLFRRHEFACERITQQVGIEKELLFAETEIIDGAQQRPVEENSAAESQSKPT